MYSIKQLHHDIQIGSGHQSSNLNWTSQSDANHKECHANLSLKLRQYGCKWSHVAYFVELTPPSLLPLSPCPLQKRNGLQMNQKMPTHGTFRSSPWALTWPTKSTNTNPLVVWFHQSEKLKMNAEHRVFLLTHQTSVPSFKGDGKRSPMEEWWWWQGCWRLTHFSSLILLIKGWTGTQTGRDLLCVYL